MRSGAKRSYPCPCCGELLNAHVEYERQATAPTQGDVSICARCRAVLEMTAIGWRHLSRGEFAEMPVSVRRAILHAAIVLSGPDKAEATALQFAGARH